MHSASTLPAPDADPSAAVKLRAALPQDALCLGVLATQVFLDTYATGGIKPAIANEVLRAFSTQAMRQLIESPGTLVCVAETEGHLIGFSQTSIGVAQPLIDTPRPAELDRLYVQQRFAGQGLGGRLLQWSEQLAQQHQATALWLSAWVHNHRALRFYARQGYADVGQTWFTMDDGQHENRVLCKPLTPAR